MASLFLCLFQSQFLLPLLLLPLLLLPLLQLPLSLLPQLLFFQLPLPLLLLLLLLLLLQLPFRSSFLSMGWRRLGKEVFSFGRILALTPGSRHCRGRPGRRGLFPTLTRCSRSRTCANGRRRGAVSR